MTNVEAIAQLNDLRNNAELNEVAEQIRYKAADILLGLIGDGDVQWAYENATR